MDENEVYPTVTPIEPSAGPVAAEPDLTTLIQHEGNAASAAPVGSQAAAGGGSASPASPLPLRLAAGLCAVIFAIGPLTTLAERMGQGPRLLHLIDHISPYLWERLIHTRVTSGPWLIGFSLLAVVLALAALFRAGSQPRLALQLFTAAVLVNGADWYWLGARLLHNPALSDPERRAVLTFTVCELALTVLLWLRMRARPR